MPANSSRPTSVLLPLSVTAMVVLPTAAVLLLGSTDGSPAANASKAIATVGTQARTNPPAAALPVTRPLAVAAEPQVGPTTAPVEVLAGAAPSAAPAASTAPTSLPTTSPASPAALAPEFASAIRTAVFRRSHQSSPVEGGGFAEFPFQDVHPAGLLIGLRIGLGKFVNNDTIHFVQPVYLTPDGEQLGRAYGKPSDRVVRVVAPPGYAVGAASIRGGGGLDSVTLTYMRIETPALRLDRRDAYITQRVGGRGGGGGIYVGGDGTPVIGISGRYGERREFLGLGLVFLRPTPAAKPH